MAESVKQQSSTSGSSATRLLRYPLRSASKQKEVKPSVGDSTSVAKRGKTASNVSKSVSVLDLSAKEKSAKPPRRLSNPPKTSVSPTSRLFGSITPIPETKTKRSSGIRGKIDTPVTKKKFSVLSSSSYWLTQIKLSEAAAKHSLTLGFFKLAFEAGCEPLQVIRDELKSYARKHDLAEFGESVKELFENYNITEKFEQLQVSVTCSHVSDEDVHSSSSVGDMEKIQKKDSVSKVRKSAAIKNVSNTQGCNTQKKPQKTNQALNNNKVKKSPKKSVNEDSIEAIPVEKALEENKENLKTPKVDEIGSTEVLDEQIIF